MPSSEPGTHAYDWWNLWVKRNYNLTPSPPWCTLRHPFLLWSQHWPHFVIGFPPLIVSTGVSFVSCLSIFSTQQGVWHIAGAQNISKGWMNDQVLHFIHSWLQTGGDKLGTGAHYCDLHQSHFSLLHMVYFITLGNRRIVYWEEQVGIICRPFRKHHCRYSLQLMSQLFRRQNKTYWLGIIIVFLFSSLLRIDSSPKWPMGSLLTTGETY